jgi:iron(III) transport system ATP-binding protein
MTAGRETAVSIRQHEIRIVPKPPDETENVVPATVVRHVFLGNSRDYMVQVSDGTQLRVVTSPQDSVAEGAMVWLHLPPERCRALAG